MKVFILTSILVVLLYGFINPPFTPLMLFRVYEQTIGDNKITAQKNWVRYENISSNMVLAVVASEDQKFPEHWGFDLDAMKAAFDNNQKGKHTKGGSTITQQTAKNVFLWPSRSYIRKAFEAWFTILIEVFWSKERTMEVYLNVIETGNGIYGIEEASQLYYKKPASKLSKNEAAMIAAILPGPRKWDPRKPTGYLLKRQKWILQQMNNLGGVDL